MRLLAAVSPSCLGSLCLVLALAAGGCATSRPGAGDPPADRPPAGTDQAATDTSTVSGTQASEPLVVEPKVVVVLKDPEHRHTALLQVFSARLGEPYEVLDLSQRSAANVRRRLRALAPARAVAVGPAALAVASAVPGLEVLQAGVLTPVGPAGGVDALPDFDAQLAAWLRENPDLTRIGVIGGPAMRARMEALEQAAGRHGLKVERREVGSDKELLLAFRSMVPSIDGFVFLPDPAVLSPPVIEEVIGHGRRNTVQIAVYSPLMLELGADIYFEPDPVAVAEGLVALLQKPGRMLSVSRLRYRLRPTSGTAPGDGEPATPFEVAGRADG